MDLKKINFEVELLRIIKPIANKANSALEEIARKLHEIHEISNSTSNDKWKQFQKETYEDLQRIEKISNDFEEKKRKLIHKNYVCESVVEINKNAEAA